tara:strand:- start:25 stop:378 length:354 start_codon:yes stop_codon:yes gene_type:complete
VHVNTRKIKTNTRKDSKKRHDIKAKERVDINPNKSYIVGMKEKIITIKVNGASQGQWSNLLLELNLIRKAWKAYGVDISLKAPGIRSVIEWGTKVNDYTRPSRRPGKRVSSNKRPTA